MRTVPKILLIMTIAGLLPGNAYAIDNNDVQRALKARNINDYGFVDMIAFCIKLNRDFIVGSGRDVSVANTSNIFVNDAQHKKFRRGYYHFVKNIAKLTPEEFGSLPLFRKIDAQFNTLLNQAADADAMRAVDKPYINGCKAINAELVSIAPTLEQLAPQLSKAQKSSNVNSNNSTDNHKECLEARDYEGCMRVKSSSGSSVLATDPCNGRICEVKVSGNDSFGLPKPMGGWYYLKADDKIYYFSKVYAVPHKGQRTRYVGMKRISRYYQNPEAGTSGQYLGGNSATTNCTGYSNTINCSTTGSSKIYIPGKDAVPGGVRSSSFHSVYDCKDNTFANYKGARLMYGGWEKTREGWAVEMVAACEKGEDYIKGLETLNVKM